MVSFERALKLVARLDSQCLSNLPWDGRLSLTRYRGMPHLLFLSIYECLTSRFPLLLLVGKRLLLLSSLSAGNDLRAICYANGLSGRPPGISFPSADSAFDSSIYLRLVISPVQK